MDQLEIKKEIIGQEAVVRCAGRLDANHAGHLNDTISLLVREGHDQIVLDLKHVDYISSFGIRALVNQYKNLKAINGYLWISETSANVAQVLNMVGMLTLLTSKPEVAVAEEKIPAGEISQLLKNDFQFRVVSSGSGQPADLHFIGQPDLVTGSGYTAGHARLFEAGDGHYALGLGAIGSNFDECKGRFGEYLALGRNVAYLPGDGSKKPDYLVGSGQLVASLTELYGVHFSTSFSHLVRFESNDKNQTITLSEIMQALSELTGSKYLVMVMVAESGGLIGTSLNQSPVGGANLFSFPEIRQSVNFTTEPAHNKKLTVSLGFAEYSAQPTNSLFSRELVPGSQLWGHFHTAVFPYMALKKREIDLDETLGGLFNESELIDILHLSNDTREINGLGESRFVQGFCWVTAFKAEHKL